MSQKPLLSLRPRTELADEIRAAAEAERRPISQFLVNLVEDALAARKRANEQRSEAA
ncbi:hypothetical protein [Bradyrhizobium sp. SBR1B]|uniref:hypothetical protein n=1 Tax=Bradyrhizobium sp. SBR1B TaxID=2663836 RepID=UPI001606C141|nr:hypothetical protein [Bradyrhizobium sp. SBR1B]MBB4378227.1 uncharacterized protein (DUF1778 family) [Bradyrhizobium sp. SBR1B]